MFSCERAEKYRKPHPMGLGHKPGDNFGWFEMPIKSNGPVLRMQVNPDFEEFEFEHVSVSLGFRCPTWDEMCKVKNLFWDNTDCVVQFHPPKSEHVNFMPFCLHLWRWTRGDFPMPNKKEVLSFKTNATNSKPKSSD